MFSEEQIACMIYYGAFSRKEAIQTLQILSALAPDMKNLQPVDRSITLPPQNENELLIWLHGQSDTSIRRMHKRKPLSQESSDHEIWGGDITVGKFRKMLAEEYVRRICEEK